MARPPAVPAALTVSVLAAALLVVPLIVLAAVRTPGFGWGGYLSALGALGAPWRGLYVAGVACAGAAIGLLGAVVRDVRAAAVLLWVSAAAFGGSAAVPCTPGCPLPVADGFPWNGPVTWTDTVHAGVSVAAFVAATGAMAVLSRRAPDWVVRRVSGVGAVALAAVMALQLVWAVLVRSHGPVTGTTERLAAATALLWIVTVAARLWWAPTACRTVERQEGDAMRLEHRFSVPAGPAETWALLRDVRAVESLLPGLTLDQVDADEVSGTVRVDVGAGQLTYRGEAAFLDRDDAARSLIVEVAGRESGGGPPASATLGVALEPGPDGTVVVLRAELDLAGGAPVPDAAAVSAVAQRMVDDLAVGVAGCFVPEVDPVHAAPLRRHDGGHGRDGAGRHRHRPLAGDPVGAVDPVEPVDDIAVPAAGAAEHRVGPSPFRQPVANAAAAERWRSSSPLADAARRVTDAVPLPRDRAARAPERGRPALRLVGPDEVVAPPPAEPDWARRGTVVLGLVVLVAFLLWLLRRLLDEPAR
jgi:carbon monoxide dehydrogenase subunit G